ncbi:MAG: hypothetical protein ABH860_00510, partial [bacterium]
MKRILLLLLVCLAFVGAAYAETFKITHINEKPNEIKAYEKGNGKYVWHSRNIAATFESNGH